jgi:hypothetical protein
MTSQNHRLAAGSTTNISNAGFVCQMINKAQGLDRYFRATRPLSFYT